MDTGSTVWKLIQACKRGDEVVITRPAQDDASAFFGLHTKAELVSFIADGGLCDLKEKNVRPWENNPTKQLVLVHAWWFRAPERRGYIAFFFFNGNWIIKSFKPDTDPEVTTRPLRR